MKSFILIAAISAAFLAACNNSNTQSGADNGAKKDEPTAASGTPQTTSASSIKEIIAGYLQLKNALAADNGNEAASAGSVMVEAFGKFDKGTLKTEQKKVYEDMEADAKEHAEHISKNGSNIKHQREHFDMLSQDIYQLVKTFGAGLSLYLDHCPMYNNNKGADWLSETKEISNPYLGKEMPACGTVKEELN